MKPNAIPKSRYDSVDMFINPDPAYDRYNDIKVLYDQESYDTLIANDIDPMLAKHIAHLFIRDALVSYDDYDSKSDTETSEHFENIQSSNWQSVRWKPPTIHMDAMGFGMGSCCLQVTFQAEGLQESRLLYDQLVVIAPLVVEDEIVILY